MRRDAGGGSVNTAVGYGLTASLFVFGWLLLGTMLLLKEIFGGPGPDVAPSASTADAAPGKA